MNRKDGVAVTAPRKNEADLKRDKFSNCSKQKLIVKKFYAYKPFYPTFYTKINFQDDISL